ncbi:MAG: Sec-independent protein translocase protein TatB [Steroidobacteraceae bacterium]
MFEVGFTEIVLIFGIALLVLGPARLPKLAADIGRWAGRARAMARQLRTQLEQETQFDPLADPKPAPPAPSNTIHSPAPNTAPNTSPNTSSYSSGDESRAAPAQLASTTPPAAAPLEDAVGEPAANLNHAPDVHTPPDESIADEPKPG